jgi:hypothetical protein
VDDDPIEAGQPRPPREPESGECCQSGCARCVFDIYWDAYAEYERELEAWKARRKSSA